MTDASQQSESAGRPSSYRVTGWIDCEAELDLFLQALEKQGFRAKSKPNEAQSYEHKQLGTLTLTAADPHLIDGDIMVAQIERFFKAWLNTIDVHFSAQLDFFEEDGRLVARRVYQSPSN